MGSLAITLDEAKLNEMCDYVTDYGLNFATCVHITEFTLLLSINPAWADYAKQRWSDGFMGVCLVMLNSWLLSRWLLSLYDVSRDRPFF